MHLHTMLQASLLEPYILTLILIWLSEPLTFVNLVEGQKYDGEAIF